MRRAARSEQGIDESRLAVGLAYYDAGVFVQLFVIQLPVEELRGTAQPAERIFYFMCELTNHLPASTMLNEQRILT